MEPGDAWLGEGDLVCTRGYFEGTHDGAFMGVPATGNKVHVPYIDIWRLDGGKAAENWVRLDMLGLMQQVKAVERLVIEAATTGSEAAALKAFALHPLVDSVTTARALLEGYRRAHPAIEELLRRS